jgi:hypothetical protein
MAWLCHLTLRIFRAPSRTRTDTERIFSPPQPVRGCVFIFRCSTRDFAGVCSAAFAGVVRELCHRCGTLEQVEGPRRRLAPPRWSLTRMLFRHGDRGVAEQRLHGAEAAGAAVGEVGESQRRRRRPNSTPVTTPARKMTISTNQVAASTVTQSK